MRGKVDFFGEIHEDKIVKIAQKAAEKRGYAIYDDYNEYMRQLICQEKLKPTGGGWYQHIIRDILCAHHRWKRMTAHRPTRFYPPGTDLDQTNQLKL